MQEAETISQQHNNKHPMEEVAGLIEKHGLVVFIGAGVSIQAPSRVPGWFALNQMIIEVLTYRVGGYLQRDQAWFELVMEGVLNRRNAGQFPPEYQAQIMAEQCGDSYFSALTSVDVSQRNQIHADLAALAKAGICKGMVTSNFDCLVEASLSQAQVPHEVFYDEAGFERLIDRKQNSQSKQYQLPMIKVHGSAVANHSMVDTLQQRLQGRKELLDEVIAKVFARHFILYVGFSASDLNHDRDYLGLCKSAEASPGALFVQFPGSLLEAGAYQLLNAYGEYGIHLEATLDEVFSELFKTLGLQRPRQPEIVDADPQATVANRLEKWAEMLHPYEAINVLTALLDAGGEEEAAFRILHKTWKTRLSVDATGEHYARYQYNYAQHCLKSGEMLYEETPQNFLRCQEYLPQAGAGALLWNLYRARVDNDFFIDLQKIGKKQQGFLEAKADGDYMRVFARAAVIYRWYDRYSDIVEAGNYQREKGDIPRALTLWASAANLAARTDDPGLAFDLFEHCAWWVNYLGDEVLLAELYLAQAIANLTLGNVDSAGWNLDKALPVFRKFQNWPLLIEGLIAAFRYSIKAGRTNEAKRLLNEASQRIAKGYEIYYPHLSLAVAEYHLGVDQPERARREIDKCRPIAIATQNSWALATIDEYLGGIDEEVGI